MGWVGWLMVGISVVIVLSVVHVVFWSMSIAASVVGLAAGGRSDAPGGSDQGSVKLLAGGREIRPS